MHLLIAAPGNSVHTLRWVDAFLHRGHRVDLVTQHPPLAEMPPGIRVHRLPHLRGAGYMLNQRRFRQLVGQLAPDVVNVHYASGYGTLARCLVGVPMVLNVWGSDVFEFPERGGMHRWWLQGNLRAAGVIVSTSKVMAKRVHELLPASRIEVVPFGVDTERFRPAVVRRDGPVVIGTVKALRHTYGIDRLLQAFAQLLAHDGLPGVRLRIVGDGPERGPLEALAGRLGIAGMVDFIGAVPHRQVPAELQKLDVYVALSRAESFGVAVIEASACGLPVVVSDVGGLPEVVAEGRTGFVVPHGAPTHAAERLHQLVCDADQRRRLGEEGRRWVQEHYAWPMCVERMEQVLQHAAQA